MSDNHMLDQIQELSDEMAFRMAARKNLIDFTRYTKPEFEVARHHRYVAGYAERVLKYLNDPNDPEGISRLIVNMPPRHTKSELFTRRLPTFFLGHNPTKFVISASYNADLATDFGRDVRGIMKSLEYQTLFPGVLLAQDSRAADRWNTVQGGAYFAAGVCGSITGRGMHLGIIDDPYKGQEDAESPVYNDKLWKWWKTDFKTRMMPNAAIIIPKTRWVKNGLVGRILDAEPGKWTVVNLPALAEDPDPLGRAEGEPLWPEWFSREALQDMLTGMSLREFSALYQGRPVAAGGNLFKTSEFRRYREVPPLEAIILCADTAWDTNEANDYSVIIAIGVGKDGFYLIGFWRDKVEYPDLKLAVNAQGLRWTPMALIIENKSSGKALVQEMQRSCRWPVIPIDSQKDKSVRARSVTPLFQSGRVLFPELAPWTELVEAELADFPGGKHDDIVDALVHGLMYLQENFMFDSSFLDSEDAEMDWDTYDYRNTRSRLYKPMPDAERHWDIYQRRVH